MIHESWTFHKISQILFDTRSMQHTGAPQPVDIPGSNSRMCQNVCALVLENFMISVLIVQASVYVAISNIGIEFFFNHLSYSLLTYAWTTLIIWSKSHGSHKWYGTILDFFTMSNHLCFQLRNVIKRILTRWPDECFDVFSIFHTEYYQ